MSMITCTAHHIPCVQYISFRTLETKNRMSTSIEHDPIFLCTCETLYLLTFGKTIFFNPIASSRLGSPLLTHHPSCSSLSFRFIFVVLLSFIILMHHFQTRWHHIVVSSHPRSHSATKLKLVSGIKGNP